MWIGLDDTLNLLSGNSFHPVHAPGGRLGMIVSIAEDKDGKLWAVSLGPPRHIVRIDPGTLQATPIPDIPQISKIASDPRACRTSRIWVNVRAERCRQSEVRKLSLRCSAQLAPLSLVQAFIRRDRVPARCALSSEVEDGSFVHTGEMLNRSVLENECNSFVHLTGACC
jgi:hypothetical protein